jgi:hypothetical protein
VCDLRAGAIRGHESLLLVLRSGPRSTSVMEQQLPHEEGAVVSSACVDDVFEKHQGLAPKSLEEKYIKIVARNTKNSDSVYWCPHCALEFHGGRQKIRGHFQVGDCGGQAYRQRSCMSAPQHVRDHFSEALEKAGKYFVSGKHSSEDDSSTSARKMPKTGTP